jgi:hypothetical protein
MQLVNFQILQLSERIKLLEEKVFKTSRKSDTTRAQQMLILKHLGILDLIESKKLTKKAKAKLLSTLLNASAENIEDDLTYINSPQSPIVTKKNYEFVISAFSEAGLKSEKQQAEKILDQIERKG